LLNIVGRFRDDVFGQAGGDYWKDLYCWPSAVVEDGGRLGVVVPAYPKHFFFQYGSTNNDELSLKGKEKEGKWFASALNLNRSLDDREKGHWLSYFKICLLISRAVRRMHAAGLAHSDLSYKNILVDPSGEHACMIDIDGLVIKGKYPPDVDGTTDFIAPEVMATSGLLQSDPKRQKPSRETDRHALSVLVYMYLLHRHPLRGRIFYDEDTQLQEVAEMGQGALFIENTKDLRNRYDLKWVKRNEGDRMAHLLPWWDLNKTPYSICGPYVASLFDRAFVEALHKPTLRPTASEWEEALTKSWDLLCPCANSACNQKWFIVQQSKPVCPFCGTRLTGVLPVLNLYSRHGDGAFMPENRRIIGYHNRNLYLWHANAGISPNEKLTDAQKQPIGYIAFYQGKWCLVNQAMPAMKDAQTGKIIGVNSMVTLEEGKQLLMAPEDGGRLIHVQMVGG
jgi:serine/threonine protein kinase